jgi:hypothetical protein
MHTWRLLLCGFLLYAAWAISAAAATEARRHDGIVYLNLTLLGGSVRLDSLSLGDGSLKVPKRVTLAADRIRFRVLDDAGAALFEGAVADPSRVTLEYVDDSGQLQSRLVFSDSARFVVRLPYDDRARRIEFNRTTATSVPGGVGRRIEKLGSLPLPSSPRLRTGGQAFPVTEIVVNGAPDKRINIVFLSEGYTIYEIGKFHEDVSRVVDSMASETPYAEYFSYFNVYAIDVPSIESGTDHPGTANDCPAGLPVFFKNTYFNSTFDYLDIHRLLVPYGSIVNSVLQNNLPFWDIAFVIVNHPWYGGSGYDFTTFALDSMATEIAFHEVGHSFADLGDEYDYGFPDGYESPNTTAVTVRDSIRWNSWIDLTTPIPTPEESAWANVIGLFEGAAQTPVGWYRPKLNCKMRELGVRFCEVCSEQTVLSVYNVLSPIESFEPPDTTLTVCENVTVAFSARMLRSIPMSTISSWYVDDQLADAPGDSLLVETSTMAPGGHEIRVLASDTTPLVRTDPYQLLAASVRWNIQIGLSTGDVNSDSVITASDIIYVVSYVFKSGPEPVPCVAVGDINCSGDITSADIISLVNYVFRSGAEPCDVCSLIPGIWSCP